MKILLIHPLFYPRVGGSQRYAEELSATIMRRYPEVEVDVLCYNTDQQVNYELYRGLKIYRIPCFTVLPDRFFLPRPTTLIYQLWQLRKNNYSFVWTHIRFFDPCWWGWVYAKLVGAKSVFTGHCAAHPQHPRQLVRWVAKLIDLTLARFSLKFYDQIQVTNQAAGQFLKRKLGVKNYFLVYGGVDTGFFFQGKHLQGSVPGKKIKIAYIGRLIESKGVKILYQAAKELLRTHPNLEFVFAGPGDLRDWLGKRTSKDKLQGKVLLLPPLNASQVKDLLQKTDLFVHPSHHNEGLPNSILEAMASGVFVIAATRGGIKELMENKKTGLLIPVRSVEALVKAVQWALSHPRKREQITQNARRLVIKRFDWEIIAEKFYQLLSNKPIGLTNDVK